MSSFTIYALVSILLTSPPCAISKVLCMSYTELNRATLSVKDTPTQMVSRRAIWGFNKMTSDSLSRPGDLNLNYPRISMAHVHSVQ